MLCDCAITLFFFFLTVLTPTPSMARWDVPPHTPTWMWQAYSPPLSGSINAERAELCDGHIRPPSGRTAHTSCVILLRHNNCWQVFPVCPPTSLSSIHQHCPPQLCPRTRHGGREDREIIRRVRKKKRRDKPGKNEIRWLFVSCRVGKKMPASRQVSCLVRSLSGAKRMKCVLWQRNRLWQPEMQTRGGLG